jgi:hypothetical protein
MAKKRIKRVLVICLCFLVPILAAVAQADDPGIGTWVNEKYDGTFYTTAKIVILPDGRELDYLRVSDTTPQWEGRSTSEEEWIDAEGNYWFKGHGIWHDYGTNQNEQEWFFLSKINASRTVLESVTSGADYPEELSPIGGQYSIYYKQK